MKICVIGWGVRKNLVYGPQTVGTKGEKLLSCIVNKREHSRFRVKSAYLKREHGTERPYNPGRAKTFKPLKLDATIKGIMAMADSLSAAAYDAHPLRDYVGAVDTAPHINIMGSYYKDPDYMKGGAAGLATTHVDVRGVAPCKAKK